MAISQEMLKIPILDKALKIIDLKLQMKFPGGNELNHHHRALNMINSGHYFLITLAFI